ncbi:MAG: 6-bladed beta-propeller [Gemmatimonadetes bacterium]|nr:6-bladed beta-propeller [Gemmatimonadota bacterium]
MTMRMRWPLVLFACHLAGCAGADERGFEVTVDSTGVSVAVNRGPGAWRDDGGWRIAEPTVRLGNVDAGDAATFGGIADVAVGTDRRVYVLDGQAREVRVFSVGGEFLFRFGRSGQGPGEFTAADALAIGPNDEVLVRDPRLFRITVFDADGAYLRSARLERPYPQFGTGETFWVDREGGIRDRLSLTLRVESPDSVALIRYTRDLEVVDTLIVYEARRSFVDVIADGVPRGGIPLPFDAAPTLAAGADGSIARATGETYRFEVLDPDGRITRIVTRDAPMVPVTSAERDAALEAMRESASQLADGGTLSESFSFPESKPAITHILPDAQGYWWVGANRTARRLATPDTFDIFDAAGRFLGPIAVGFRVFEIGTDWIAGVEQDELGVDYVIVAPLIRR